MRVIIADDERIVRHGIIQSIDWKVYGIDEVLEAENGKVCLEKMARTRIDLMIADIRMPRLDGVRLGQAVSEKYPDCKIIFISAYTDKEYLKSAISLNVVAYVEKPISLAELSEAIGKASNQIRIRERRDGKAYTQQLLRALLTRRCLPPDAKGLMTLCENKSYCCAQVEFKSDDDMELYVEVEAISASFAQCGADVWVFGDIVKHNYVVVCAMPKGADIVSVCRGELEAYGRVSACGRMFASVGGAVGIRDLFLSFEQAGIGMQSRFFRDYGCVVIGSQAGAPRKEYCLSQEKVDMIRSAAHNCLEADFADILKEMREELMSGAYTRESVRAAAMKILNLLGMYGGDKFIAIPYMERVPCCDTLKELETLIQHAAAEVFRYGELSDRMVREAMRLIAREYGNTNLSIGYICSELNVSKSKLCSQFRQAAGKSINEYINCYRILVACELIETEEIPLKDIAQRTGFNDLNYFSKTFKKIAGVLPSAYKDMDT